jgi:hypothetical protein
MMKIQLVPHNIATGIMDEDSLADLSIMESIYAIRKLRAAILLAGKVIEVDDPNKYGQVFLSDFDIGIAAEEYKILAVSK